METVEAMDWLMCPDCNEPVIEPSADGLYFESDTGRCPKCKKLYVVHIEAGEPSTHPEADGLAVLCEVENDDGDDGE
jgi:phage FluMu protein Com